MNGSPSWSLSTWLQYKRNCLSNSVRVVLNKSLNCLFLCQTQRRGYFECREVAVMLLLHWATSCRSNPDGKKLLWWMNGPSYWTWVTKTDFQSHGLKSSWHYCAKALFAICNFLGGMFVRYHLHSVLIRCSKSTTTKGDVSFLYLLHVPVCLLSSFQNLN